MQNIELQLKLCNWRKHDSIWGKLSKLLFQRNLNQYRQKIMLLWHKNHYNVRKRFESSHSVHKIDSSEVSLLVSIEIENLSTSGIEFSKKSDNLEKLSEVLIRHEPIISRDSPSKFSEIVEKEMQSSLEFIDYPTRSLVCSNENMSIIPDAFCDQILHGNSPQTTMDASDVTHPRVERKEKLEGDSTKFNQFF